MHPEQAENSVDLEENDSRANSPFITVACWRTDEPRSVSIWTGRVG